MTDQIESPIEKYVYDHIPTLKELLPTNAGRPGVQYAQITSDNLWLAQQNGWSKLSGRQKIYKIRGPKGEVACELYGRGEPIRGQSSKSGKRVCWLDKAIREQTGLGEKPKIYKDTIEPKGIGTFVNQPEGSPVVLDDSAPTEEKPKVTRTQKSVDKKPEG